MSPRRSRKGRGVCVCVCVWVGGLGWRMLPGVGPCPMYQKMQLEAVIVGFLSGEESTLWKWFSACIKPAPGSPGRGKGGLAAAATPWPSSVTKQPVLIFLLGPPILSLWVSRRISYYPGCKMCLEVICFFINSFNKY